MNQSIHLLHQNRTSCANSMTPSKCIPHYKTDKCRDVPRCVPAHEFSGNMPDWNIFHNIHKDTVSPRCAPSRALWDNPSWWRISRKTDNETVFLLYESDSEFSACRWIQNLFHTDRRGGVFRFCRLHSCAWMLCASVEYLLWKRPSSKYCIGFCAGSLRCKQCDAVLGEYSCI